MSDTNIREKHYELLFNEFRQKLELLEKKIQKDAKDFPNEEKHLLDLNSHKMSQRIAPFLFPRTFGHRQHMTFHIAIIGVGKNYDTFSDQLAVHGKDLPEFCYIYDNRMFVCVHSDVKYGLYINESRYDFVVLVYDTEEEKNKCEYYKDIIKILKCDKLVCIGAVNESIFRYILKTLHV